MGHSRRGNVVHLLGQVVVVLILTRCSEALAPLTISNQTYWLSSTPATVSSAREQCAAQSADLALFDTNAEYAAVFGYIKKQYTSVLNLWIDFIATDADNNSFYEHSWRSENISSSEVWYYGEPNENCLTVSQPCCARVDFDLAGLRDMLCSWQYLFLCKPRMECRDGSHNCSQVCLERDVGFACSCRAGYALAGDKASCRDVDECANKNANTCGQVCVNTVGSYRCECYRGFKLTVRGNISCEDINECEVGAALCSHVCTNTNGSYQCSCFPGYGLSADKHNCTDVDECSQAPGLCSQVCDNTLGSYTCGCLAGFTLMGDNHTCEDLDECYINSSSCQHVCINTNGSYHCGCNRGYLLGADGVSCVDVDECAVNSTNTCGGQQPCTNTPGGYFCGCPRGYEAAQSLANCVDVDECVSGSHNCSQICNNTPGGYLCGCRPGYYLSIDNLTCADIDECTGGSRRCSHVCTNFEGSYQCSCEPGFRLDHLDNISCTDIDECVENPRSCEQICDNTEGSYHCSCGKGFALDVDLASCTPSKTLNHCPCSCTFYARILLNATDNSLVTTNIRKSLILHRTSLASYRNMKVTIDDSRVSSQTIGFSGVVFMTLFLGVIIIPELVEFLVKLAIRFKKK